MKILIEMKHGLGDCVCAIPMIRAIRTAYPSAYIAMIVNSRANEELFKHSNIKIDKFYYLSVKGRSKCETLHTIWQLYKEHFDYGILAIMTPRKKGKALFRFLRIKHLIGEQYGERNIYTDFDNEACVDRSLDLLSYMGIKIPLNHQPILFVSEKEQQKIQKKLITKTRDRKRILVNIGSGGKFYYKKKYYLVKKWPYMKNFIDKIAHQDIDIYLLGGPLEEDLLEQYKDILHRNNVANFVNKLSVSESIALISQMDLSVGVDTGMQHVADALGIKTVSIFGPANPSVYKPYSDRAKVCQVHLDCQYCLNTPQCFECKNRKCMSEVTIKDVYQQVMECVYNDNNV